MTAADEERITRFGEALTADQEQALASIVRLLRERTGHDLSKYKAGTILRLMRRRMHLDSQPTIGDYLHHLRTHADAIAALVQDVSVSVTRFFRDLHSWEYLQARVIRPLVEVATADAPVRAWVVACATGEEAYSLAILFDEEFERRQAQRNYTIIASDVDWRALAKARSASYSPAIASQVSERRLKRYFRTSNGHYHIEAEIRQHVMFARHDVLHDMPFSKLDLVACRNLFIYLGIEAQEQLSNAFCSALHQDGFLFLGDAESVNERLFRPLAKKHRVFVARSKAIQLAAQPKLRVYTSGHLPDLEADASTPMPSEPSGTEGLECLHVHALPAQESVGMDGGLRAVRNRLRILEEEHRSTTERLETARQELQSIDEELQAVNHELRLKVNEATHATDDVANLLADSDVGTLFLDPDFRITRFTQHAGVLLDLAADALERPLAQCMCAAEYAAIKFDLQSVLTAQTPVEREITTQSGRILAVRIRPYRTKLVQKTAGLVLTCFDLTDLRRAESALQESQQRLAIEDDVMRTLHAATIAAATATSLEIGLDGILVAAIRLQQADLGNIQLLDAERRQLRIVAHRGFDEAFLKRFEWVAADDATSCGAALRTRQTAHISDIPSDPEYIPLREAAAQAGYRAVQSTPLISRAGVLLGVLSVHFRASRAFSDREERLGEMLARQVADVIQMPVLLAGSAPDANFGQTSLTASL